MARMEDILDLYAEADDRYYPVVCFDECPIQLVSEVRKPIAAQPGQRRRYDYHYRREGTANLFIAFWPGQGWRHITITDRRTKRDFALQMKALVDVFFRKRSKSVWCWTTLIPMLLPLSMKPSLLRKLVGFCAVWSFTTLQFMPVG